MQYSSAPRTRAVILDGAGLRDHYAQVIVPMWRGRGYYAPIGLPLEAILPDPLKPPLAITRFRAMACARQLYVFSVAADAAHARGLFDALVNRFADRENGGFHYSVGPDATPLETEKDLYTHAFVIFACAAYYRLMGDNRALAVIGRTFDVVNTRFPTDPANGLPVSKCSRNFESILELARQNPLMHLTEAYLEAMASTKDARFDSALDLLLCQFVETFLDRKTDCVLELPLTDTDNWIEPGHQFEWCFLRDSSRHPGFTSSGLGIHLDQAYAFAQQHGVVPQSGGVVAALDRTGAVRDANQRIWAQTEYLRAMACHPDPAQRAQLPEQIARFAGRFLHDAGWHEMLSDDDQVIRAEMPSTTAYHLIGAYQVLP
ncbi:AGE family epimerase/isomerase [Robbsia andropogonis]|uniref:AGE family epimerase/isomerase n=1 Tax=Robbsia andropogonis TaxID=28092 RepID=UPI000465E256|nr:AGE family epimerase/isomerase [Robbsia andropogonis]MCP1116618.1 AGE family epimerase/isomerase [Robbsia andropogonis]MCP1126703.1 AGE family epimerase/isomerase [Robbsia andropogonis]